MAFRFFIVFALGVVLCFGAVVIVLFMVLVARTFEFFNTAFWAIIWVIAWLVFSFDEKNS
ncbi:hypothetical protein N407_00880 [Helicobacter pylori FD662]|nr:hypothetical protein N407_00880 [Helicobacter pylori FD662]